MYKTGYDTQATTTLLLYGAAADREYTPHGAAPWVDDDSKEAVLEQLRGYAASVARHTAMSEEQLEAVRPLLNYSLPSCSPLSTTKAFRNPK